MENLYNTNTEERSGAAITTTIGFTDSHVVKTTVTITQGPNSFDGFPSLIHGRWVPGSRMNTDMI